MPLPYDLITERDNLQELADDAAMGLVHSRADDRGSQRIYLAAIVEAWRILDREVTRLAEEE